MPIDFFYDENGGIIVKAKGIVTGREIIDFNNRLYEANENIKKIPYQILDFTDVDDVSFSIDDVDTLSVQDRKALEINPNMLIAVVSENQLIYGLARMWEVKSGGGSSRTQVFRKLEEAYAWIESQLDNT